MYKLNIKETLENTNDIINVMPTSQISNIKTIFGSSLSPVVRKRAHVLFTLSVSAWV